MTVLYVAGRITNHETYAWELLGVFSTSQAAAAVCSKPDDFVGPVTLDEAYLEDEMTWPGITFPVW